MFTSAPHPLQGQMRALAGDDTYIESLPLLAENIALKQTCGNQQAQLESAHKIVLDLLGQHSMASI